MSEGIMSSSMWKDENKEEILGYLRNIIDIRREAILNASDRGERERYRDSLSLKDGHSRILSYVMQIAKLLESSDGVDFKDVGWEEPDNAHSNFDIIESEGYNGTLSEVGNLNPSDYGEDIDPHHARASSSAKESKNNSSRRRGYRDRYTRRRTRTRTRRRTRRR